jgi:hypothetical protein
MAQQNQINTIIELGVSQANVNARDQNLAIAALAQENARARVSAGSVTDLTDNSSGTAASGNALAAVVNPTTVAQDGAALLAPKAAFDTQIGLIEDAHEELGVKASEIIALIASGSRTVSSIDAAATADDTIAAITSALTGSAAADQGVPAADGIAQIVHARNVQATLAAAINWLRVAQGLAPITDNSGGHAYISDSAWGTIADAAATGTAAAAGENSLSETTVEAALAALNNNIASMAAALTEANAPAIGPFVVATNNPRTRFSAGDVTP